MLVTNHHAPVLIKLMEEITYQLIPGDPIVTWLEGAMLIIVTFGYCHLLVGLIVLNGYYERC